MRGEKKVRFVLGSGTFRFGKPEHFVLRIIIAKAKLFPTGRKTEVRLQIGIPMFTFVFMCLWSCGVLFGLVVCIPQIFQSDSMFAVSVFALFMLVAIVLVCFGFYLSLIHI